MLFNKYIKVNLEFILEENFNPPNLLTYVNFLDSLPRCKLLMYTIKYFVDLNRNEIIASLFLCC